MVELQFSGVREVVQFLTDLPRRWQIKTHDAFVGWGRELKSNAEALSPEDKLRGVDPRRRPAGERLALQWQIETGFDGDEVFLHLGNVDPKMEFILFPTEGGTVFTSTGPWLLRWYLPSGQVMRAVQVTKGDTEGQPAHEWALQQFDLDGNISRLADNLVRS